jgi:putative hydrolase of the HAD superfamily
MDPAQIFQQLSQPLEPIPTGISPQLLPVVDIRAVLFDIYGTLIISGCGDIGTSIEVQQATALEAALASLGIALRCPADDAIQTLHETIANHHTQLRKNGITYPEVNIIEVWRETCAKLGGLKVDPARLAVEFEARTNPVWPMPGLEPCLAELVRRGLVLGLISNAQFFTPSLFPALVGKTLDELGFAPDLRYYSYEHRHAKPSDWMYRLASKRLASQGIHPTEVLYIGNDMRNDVLPATQVGFRTALFAGDTRSLRLRETDPSLGKTEPDAIILDLLHILDLMK